MISMSVLPIEYCCSAATCCKHVFEALLNGATICPYDMKVNGLAGLAERIDCEAITLCKFFPRHFRSFVDGLSGREQFSDAAIDPFGRVRVFTQETWIAIKVFRAGLFAGQFVFVHRDRNR
jgi:hypothetical protein